MKPLIPVWLIYLAGIADDLKAFFDDAGGALIIVAIFIAAILLIVSAVQESFQPFTRWFKKVFSCVVFGFLFMFISTIIPSQKATYTMLVASQVTPDNIELVGGTVKTTVDYMFEKTGELINNLKETKK